MLSIAPETCAVSYRPSKLTLSNALATSYNSNSELNAAFGAAAAAFATAGQPESAELATPQESSTAVCGHR